MQRASHSKSHSLTACEELLTKSYLVNAFNAFETVDSDHNGFLDRSEMEAALLAARPPAEHQQPRTKRAGRYLSSSSW